MTPSTTAAVILAGGRATRMGGIDKGLIELAGRPLVSHVIDALRDRVEHILISANRNHAAYAALGAPTVSDTVADFPGPLAGIAAALQAVDTELLFVCPCDSPFLCGSIITRLNRALMAADADIAVAHDGQRPQPVFALLRCTLLPDLLKFLDAGERKILFWYRRHKLCTVDFSDHPDMFMNINSIAECAAAERRLAALAR